MPSIQAASYSVSAMVANMQPPPKQAPVPEKPRETAPPPVSVSAPAAKSVSDRVNAFVSSNKNPSASSEKPASQDTQAQKQENGDSDQNTAAKNGVKMHDGAVYQPRWMA